MARIEDPVAGPTPGVDVTTGGTATRLRALGAAAALVAACSADSFPDRTARVEVDGESTTFRVDACGVEGDTLLVLASNGDGDVLQLALGVAVDGDGYEARLDEVGVTVDIGSRSYAAFTPRAWTASRRDGSPPGDVTSARLRGSRAQVRARTETGGSLVDLDVEVRCDGEDVA